MKLFALGMLAGAWALLALVFVGERQATRWPH